MRIAAISHWFSEKMGYGENCLPRAWARAGHDVHLITSRGQVYFHSPIYKEVYEPFLGPPLVEAGTKSHEGYTLHRLPHGFRGQRLCLLGLTRLICRLKPDIVQTFEIGSDAAIRMALLAPIRGFKHFLECHVHESVLSSSKLRRMNPATRPFFPSRQFAEGRVASMLSKRCYIISDDTAVVASRVFGVQPSKVTLSPLGVDVATFRPAFDTESQAARLAVRTRFDFGSDAVVCVYSGRFTPDKNPLCLAKAIDLLVKQGLPYRGLFVGDGPQAQAMSACAGCILQPFVPFVGLRDYYVAADVGVWPSQESTSQLDALACGLPVVLSDKTSVTERVDGCGATYAEGDPRSLADAILSLGDSANRRSLGEVGAKKVQDRYSWDVVANMRIEQYTEALKGT